ncbi:MAG: DegT/DnrJ/EryC1/StrS family aminotransferase, partial [Pseudobdellovibrionaceae bacterium]
WYKQNSNKCIGDLQHARWAANHVISLPMYPDMDEKTQSYIIEQVTKALQG